MIIIINGQGGVGKDTLINNLDLDYMNVSSITPCMDVLNCVRPILKYCNVKDEYIDNPKPRDLLFGLKKILDNYCDLSISYLLTEVNKYLDMDCHDVMFVHVREPENIIRFKRDIMAFYNVEVKTLLITRGDKKHFNNASDNNVFNYIYDYEFNNNKPLNESIIDFNSLIKTIVRKD